MSAWTELGTPLGPTLSAEEAMKLGLLAEWNVRQVPMFATLPAVRGISRQVEVTDRVAVVRDNPRIPDQTDYLSIVSPRYTIVQNEAYAPVLDQLAEESGSPFVYAGEVDGGRCAFLTMRLPGHLDGGVEVFLTALNDHGGYKPFTLLLTPVHTVTGSILSSVEVAKIRHSPGALAASQGEARAVLDRMFAYLEPFQKTILRLDSTPLSLAQFEYLLDRDFGVPLEAPKTTRSRKRAQRDTLCEMFAAKEGDTAWDGFTTLTDWYDHLSPVRGDTSRAYKAIFDAEFKTRALRVMEKVA